MTPTLTRGQIHLLAVLQRVADQVLEHPAQQGRIGLRDQAIGHHQLGTGRPVEHAQLFAPPPLGPARSHPQL